MCALYRKEALSQIGKMFQPTIYGHDDVLMCKRLMAAGWRLGFIPHIHVDHTDATNTEFSLWKRDMAGETFSSGIWAGLMEQLDRGEYYSPDGERLEKPS